MCGYCGKEFDHNIEHIPPEVASLLRSLVQHGLFQIMEPVKHHPQAGKTPASSILRLDRFEGCYCFANCTINWCYLERDKRKEEIDPCRYERSKISCFVPEPIHQAASLITKSDNGHYNAMNLTTADVLNGKRKTLRFERYCKLIRPGTSNHIVSDTHLRIRIEIRWQLPEEGANSRLFIPTHCKDMAMKVLQSGLHALDEDWHLCHLRVCTDLAQAERRAAELPKLDSPIYLICYECNPYAAGYALVQDLHIKLRHEPQVPITLDQLTDVLAAENGHPIGSHLVEALRHVQPSLELIKPAK